MRTYLLTGCCGTGKTWVMKQLIEKFELNIEVQEGLYWWRTNTDNSVLVLGKYRGETFEGSDKLSMAVMTDNSKVKPIFEGKVVIAEGDRFTNSTFIEDFSPVIIRVKGDGSEGRVKRGSAQTERQIKSIRSRVENITYDAAVENSLEALELLVNEINQPVLKHKEKPQSSLF